MIRTATPQDAAAIAQIYNHYIAETIITFEKEPVSVSEMTTRISDVLSLSLPWLVIEDETGPFGYAYASKWRTRPAYQYTVETTVYLSANATGKGFGRELYSSLLSQLQSDGYHTAIGGIALPNQPSVRLHEALGFKQIAHFQEVGYKFDRWIDVGFWQIMLT